MRYRSDDDVKYEAYIHPYESEKGHCFWLDNYKIPEIKFNLGDLIKDENNLQSIKLLIKKKLKNNYCNLVFDNNIPIKVKKISTISHSAENREKIEEQAYIFRRTGRCPTEDEEEENNNIENNQTLEDVLEDLLGERNKQINTDKIFELDECVIRLTNPPNVLFCNCGHLCICVECDRVKSLNTSPVCKIETTIK